MTRVRTATEGKDYDLAIKLLTAIIDIKPDYIEAWNRRATLYFHKRDYTSAMSDLRSVLAREPRHFGAWAGLGMILNDVGDERRALLAFRRAVELYPHMDRIQTDQASDRDRRRPRSVDRALLSANLSWDKRAASAPAERMTNGPDWNANKRRR